MTYLKAPRAALYARTSRTGQHIGVQLAQLRAVAEQRGWEVTGEYVDEEVSSRRLTRPQFQLMLGEAHNAKVDMVVAVALDRFARSTKELLRLVEQLQGWRVNMVSLREQIDTSSAVGKLTFTVLSALAEFERELLRERTLAGLEAAKRRGKVLGRPKATVDTGQIVMMRSQGIPWSQIVTNTGFSESTLRRAYRKVAPADSLTVKKVSCTGNEDGLKMADISQPRTRKRPV